MSEKNNKKQNGQNLQSVQRPVSKPAETKQSGGALKTAEAGRTAEKPQDAEAEHPVSEPEMAATGRTDESGSLAAARESAKAAREAANAAREASEAAIRAANIAKEIEKKYAEICTGARGSDNTSARDIGGAARTTANSNTASGDGTAAATVDNADRTTANSNTASGDGTAAATVDNAGPAALSRVNPQETGERIEEFRLAFQRDNRSRIRAGIVCLLAIPLVFLVLMFMTGSDRTIFLMLWVISMFLIAIYLIYAEYMGFKVDQMAAGLTGRSTDEMHAQTAEAASDMGFKSEKKGRKKQGKGKSV